MLRMKIWSMNIMYTMNNGQIELQAVISKTKLSCFLFRLITLSSKNCIKGIELTYRGANIARTVVTAQPELRERKSCTVTIRSVAKSKRAMYSSKYSITKIRLQGLEVYSSRYSVKFWSGSSVWLSCFNSSVGLSNF